MFAGRLIVVKPFHVPKKNLRANSAPYDTRWLADVNNLMRRSHATTSPTAELCTSSTHFLSGATACKILRTVATFDCW
jgi:hypothetical protein